MSDQASIIIKAFSTLASWRSVIRFALASVGLIAVWAWFPASWLPASLPDAHKVTAFLLLGLASGTGVGHVLVALIDMRIAHSEEAKSKEASAAANKTLIKQFQKKFTGNFHNFSQPAHLIMYRLLNGNSQLPLKRDFSDKYEIVKALEAESILLRVFLATEQYAIFRLNPNLVDIVRNFRDDQIAHDCEEFFSYEPIDGADFLTLLAEFDTETAETLPFTKEAFLSAYGSSPIVELESYGEEDGGAGFVVNIGWLYADHLFQKVQIEPVDDIWFPDEAFAEND